MRKLILLLIISLSTNLSAQEVYLETGRTSSSFKFINNEGESLENLQPLTKSYVGAGFKHEIFTKGLNITTGLSYNTYGAIGSEDDINNFFEWDINYLGLDLGLDYELVQGDFLSFYIQLAGSANFLLNGVQTINEQVFDIKNMEEFKDVPFFIRAGGGLRFKLSDNAKIYLQYLYGSGLALNNSNNSSITELTINLQSVGIGLLLAIPANKKEETRDETDINE